MAFPRSRRKAPTTVVEIRQRIAQDARVSSVATTPFKVPGLPVRALRVEVIEGPDTGKSLVGESETLTVGTAEDNNLVLTDSTVSRYHLELSSGEDGVRVVDCGSTNGTAIGGVHVERALVPPGSVLRLGRSNLRVGDGERVTVDLHGEDALGGLRGRTPIMRRLMARIERAAQSEAAVLLCGESGTGKELIARALHDLSPRSSGPFVTVDCGALPPTLVASELFGHEKGAFTGADRTREGAFERAHGGTIFLDEIGELPAALQTTLLGVLERRQFKRVGGYKHIEVDIRVVSATNRDLRSDVNRETFRLDLYYRLAVVSLRVPALRERADDVPLLVEHFLRELGHDERIDELFSTRVLDSLRAHHWPGNVRELRNFVEATVAMGEQPQLDEPAPAAQKLDAQPDVIEPLLELRFKDARRMLLDEFERRYARRLLDRAGGNVSKAARDGRMDRTYLIDLLHRHRLK
jgi:DNA-binding NtrC family response regulator